VTAKRLRLAPLLALLVAAIVRAALWAEVARMSVDGDTAIIGLMARHPWSSTTMWGQPYGSPVEAWLAAPFVAVLGPSPAALRVLYALLSLVLVVLAYRLAEMARAGAGLPAALLVACPPAYALLLSAVPPPLYPTTLVLLGLLLGSTAEAVLGLDVGLSPSRGRAILIGVLAGLALWTHLMSLATLAMVAVALAVAARRVTGGTRRLAWSVASFALASAPWWMGALHDRSALAVLGVAHEGQPMLAHAAAVARRIQEPVSGLFGAWCPLSADEGERVVRLPATVAAVMAALWVAAAVSGLRATHRTVAALLAGTIVLTLAAYPFPLRSDEHTLRFLTPALLPLAVLAGVGAVGLAGPARAPLLVVPLCVLQLWTGFGLWRSWRRAGPAAIVPDCAPVLDALVRHGVARAYASYHTAYCLAYTSGESVIASPPWNERFFGHPLPYLDTVRSDPRAAWVLFPGVDFELPAPRTFEGKLAGIGGRATRLDAGPARVYVDFIPPFGPAVESGVLAGPAGDGDLRTRVVEPGTGASTFVLDRPVAAAGLTLLAGPTDPGLPPAMDLEVSSDGSSFERIGRRRPSRQTVDLAWMNGHPQFLTDGLAFAVPLDGRTVVAVRITPADPQPWAIAEMLLHAVTSSREPWTTSSDASRLYRELISLRHR